MLLSTLLNIQKQDTKKLVLFWTFNFCAGMAASATMCAATSLFLKRVGISYMPYLYLFNALFLILVSNIYLGLADKVKRGKLYLFTFIIVSLLFIAIRIGIYINEEVKWIYALLSMITFASWILLDAQNWTIIDDSLNPFQGRRLAPLISMGGYLGGVIIGILLDSFVDKIGTHNVPLLWIFMIGISTFLLSRKDIHQIIWKKRTTQLGEERKPMGLISFIKGNPLIIILIFFFLSTGAVEYLLDYQFNKVMNITFPNEDHLTGFLGVYTAIYSGAIIILQFFVMGRVLSSRGITLAFLLLPLSQIFGLSMLTISFTFVVAFFVNFLYDTVSYTFFDPSYEVAAITFPHQYRGRIKGLLEGIVSPLGICLSSIYLIFLGNILHPAITSGVACSITIVWTLVAFNFRKVFRNTHVKNLFSDDPVLIFNAIQSLGEKGNVKAIKPLLELLKITPKDSFRKNIVISLGNIRDGSVIKTLVECLDIRNEDMQISAVNALSRYKDYNVTYSLLKFLRSEHIASLEVKVNLIFVLSHIVGKSIIPFLMDLLHDPDIRIRANTVEAIGILKDRKSISILTLFLNDPNNRVRANAIVALHRFKKMRGGVEKALIEMYNNPSKQTKVSAIYAVGKIQFKELKKDLHNYINDPDEDTRRNAVVALARLKDFHSADPFVGLMTAGCANERQSIQMAKYLMEFSKPLRSFIIEKISKSDEASKKYLIKILSMFPEAYSDEIALLSMEDQAESMLSV